MKSINLSLCFILMVTFQLFGQIDTSFVNQKIAEAKSFEQKRQFQDAFDAYILAANPYKVEEDWDGYMDVIKEFRFELFDSPIRKDVLAFLLNLDTAIDTKEIVGVSPAAKVQLWLTIVRTNEADYEWEQMQKYLDKSLLLLDNLGLDNWGRIKTLQYYGRFFWLKEEITKAIPYFKSSVKLAEKLGEKEDLYKGNIMLAICATSERDFQNALDAYNEIAFLLKDDVKQQDLRADIIANIGNTYITLNQYQKAIDYTLKAISTFTTPHNPSIASCYNNLGVVYGVLGDFDKQLFYYEKSLNHSFVNLGEDHPSLVAQYHNLGSSYSHNKYNLEQGIKYTQKALDLSIETYGPNHYQTGQNYCKLASILEDDKSYYSLAKEKLQQAKKIFLQCSSQDKALGLSSYENILGDLAYQQKEYKTAIHHATTAIEHLENQFLDKVDIELLIPNYINRAKSYYEIEAYELALEEYQLLLNKIFPDLVIDSNNYKFSIKEIPYKSRIIEVLANKAKVFLGLYEQSKNEEYLTSSFQQLQYLDSLNKEVKILFLGNKNRKIIANNGSIIKEGLLKCHLYFYEKNKNIQHFKEAFLISEQNKNSIIREQLQHISLKNIKGIPDSLIEKEQELLSLLAFYEKEQFIQVGTDVIQRKADLAKKIIDLKTDYQELTDLFKEKYPQYYQLKFNLNYTTFADLQKNILKKNETLIEYFKGEKEIYAFIIQQDQVELIKIPIKETAFLTTLEKFSSNCHQNDLSQNRSEVAYLKNADDFAQSAHQLYQQLILPIEKEVTLSKKLIIIPSGNLGYIPFEILLKTLPKKSSHYATHDYLLKDYQISYCYSATLLEEMTNQKIQPKHYQPLAFDPTFKETPLIASTAAVSNRKNLNPLYFNSLEIEKIDAIVSSRIFSGGQATEANFRQHAPDYQIIHLATHGKANNILGDYSYLAFTEIPDSIENEFVYTQELYNMELNADMVVLSACETGIGRLQVGEGIASLARAFSFAGAKSVINTLWSINDEKTASLMEIFYQHLKNGATKDASLRQAKLDYLENHPHAEAHPYYWAAFTAVGDMEAIDFKQSNWWWMSGIGVLLLGLFFWWYRK